MHSKSNAARGGRRASRTASATHALQVRIVSAMHLCAYCTRAHTARAHAPSRAVLTMLCASASAAFKAAISLAPFRDMGGEGGSAVTNVEGQKTQIFEAG